MQDSAPIRLKLLNLPDADKSTFERVLSFFAARGNTFEIYDGPDVDLIITTDDHSNIEEALSLQQENLMLVVSNDQNCLQGDLQLQRPLLVTRVMRIMEQAAKQHRKAKKESQLLQLLQLPGSLSR